MGGLSHVLVEAWVVFPTGSFNNWRQSFNGRWTSVSSFLYVRRSRLNFSVLSILWRDTAPYSNPVIDLKKKSYSSELLIEFWSLVPNFWIHFLLKVLHLCLVVPRWRLSKGRSEDLNNGTKIASYVLYVFSSFIFAFIVSEEYVVELREVVFEDRIANLFSWEYRQSL